jgi:cytochrome c551/c552
MRRLLLALVVASLWLAASVGAEHPGKKVFDTLRCGVCHKPEPFKKYPSLKKVAQAYQGKSEQLVKYLNGEAEAIVEPENTKRMKRYVEKTKALSEADRKILSEFILSHSE